MSKPSAEWIASAVAITPSFETEGDPYQGVAGDFDKMGISCGALQWNIGKASLQPMVQAAGKAIVTGAMPTYGEEMWQACSGTVKKGLVIVRSWQNGSVLKAKAKAELRAFMGTSEMRMQQQTRIDAKADVAYGRANAWAEERDGSQASKRLFCWFFDVVTQNGSLEGLTPKKVSDFIALNNPDKVDDLICDFLESHKGTSGHVKDAHKNGALWRNKADGEKLEILCMSYLRAGTALPKWQHVVLNRKGTLAIGRGWVNSKLRDFSHEGL